MRTDQIAAAALIGSLALAGCKAQSPSDKGAAPGAAAPSTAAAPATPATETPAPVNTAAGSFTGVVAETMDGGNYTYLRLQNGSDEIWAAAPQFDARVGERISITLDMPMREFRSPTLNRTFPLIYFVTEVGRNGQAAQSTGAAMPPMMSSHAGADAAGAAGSIAPPRGGTPIAEVFARRSSLAGTRVTVRGRVVTGNSGINDRNYLHLQDGSGSADAHDNDLTVTTTDRANPGDIVTATGVLATNKDSGVGFTYEAIVEDATVTR
jgi:hypothetical protein